MSPTFKPTVSACHNFLKEGKEQVVTIVIAPTTETCSENKILLSWSCSRGRECETQTCIYSKARYWFSFSSIIQYRKRDGL